MYESEFSDAHVFCRSQTSGLSKFMIYPNSQQFRVEHALSVDIQALQYLDESSASASDDESSSELVSCWHLRHW